MFSYLLHFDYYETWTNQVTGGWLVKPDSRSSSMTPGRVVERNSGSVRIAFLFDNVGDDEPGG